MDIKQLNIFLEVCKYKSFYQTSKMLYMTPQGVSKKIKNLENELGIALFERDSKGLRLTQEGDYLYQNSGDLVREYNALMQELANLRGSKTDLINLRVATDMLCTLPSDVLLSFASAYPEIKLMTTEDYEMECENSIFNETADIALTAFPMDTRKFTCFPVIKKQVYLLVYKDHHLASKEQISLNDLNGEKLITMDYKHRSYLSFEQICREKGIHTHIVDMTNSILGLYYKAHNQRGIGFSVEGIVDKLNYPDVRTIPIDIEEYAWNITLITKKGRQISNTTQILIDHILRKCSS
ncbi:MAG: LysR family transcriptional regulator [Eubacteriales bacterium]|nr:LysR family transcriptional regulator [Eubacteriales bacterium]